MSISAAHFNEVTNGYEKQSDGLWVHKGKLSVGPVGTALSQPGDLNVNRGSNPVYSGQGAIYFGGSGSQYLYFDSTKWVFNPPLTTTALAAGAVQQRIGGWVGTPAWSTTTTAQWINTPISTGSIACTGAEVRIEASMAFSHSVAAGGITTGFGNDGSVQVGLSYHTVGGIGWTISASWVWYLTPTAGNHTFTVMVYNNTPGTLTLSPAVTHAIWAIEQRR